MNYFLNDTLPFDWRVIIFKPRPRNSTISVKSILERLLS